MSDTDPFHELGVFHSLRGRMAQRSNLSVSDTLIKLEGNAHGQWVLVVEAFAMSVRIERVTKLTQEINISPRLVVVSRVLIVNIETIKPIVLEYLN